jgi:hypothetical protein
MILRPFTSSFLQASVITIALFSVRPASALVGADTCAAATLSSDSLAAPLVVNDTTVGQADDLNIDSHSTEPACTEAPTCTGQGAAATLPGGQTFPSTGIGPDRVFRFRVDSACTLSVNMDPAAADLNVTLAAGGCGNTAAECSCTDDTGASGTAEVLTGISAVPGVDYYLIVDGFAGASDAFSLTITRDSGTCNLVTASGGSDAGSDAGVISSDAGADAGVTSDASTSSPDGSVITSDAAVAVDASIDPMDASAPVGGSPGATPDASSGGNGGSGGNNGQGGNVFGGGDPTADSGVPTASSNANDDGGCGCVVVGSERTDTSWLGLLGALALVMVARRSRGVASR